jgi:hypothetical protein
VLRFAVHRPGNPVASPRSHRMPCGNVLSSVHIRVTGKGAGGTAEDCLALARLPIHVPTSAAALARERSIDLLNSADCLLVQTANQQTPAGREDLPVQPSLLGGTAPGPVGSALGTPSHFADMQLLDADHVEATRQISADLLAPILADVCFPRPQPGDCELGLGSAVAAAFRAGQPTLQQAKAPLAWSAYPRAAQHFAGGQRRTDSHSPVDADDLTHTRTWDSFGYRGERDMPPSSPITGDPERLHPAWDGARPAEPDPPTLRDKYFSAVAVQSAHMFWLDRNNTEAFVAASFAPCRLAVGSAEEVPHSLGKVAERLLLHHLTPGGQPGMFPPRGRELPALLHVTRRLHPPGTPPRLLLAGKVPHEPSMFAMRSQHCFLGSQRKQPEAAHTKTLSTTTDILEEVKR